jgi:protoporphyrinogen oxidase
MSGGVLVIGGGFTGLAVAMDLARAGVAVTLLEADAHLGGLAGSFETAGEPIDRFYHHWFTSDLEVMRVIDTLGLADQVTVTPSLTGVYYNRQILRLSTPLDLLRFPALALKDRLRLGWLALKVRRLKDWRALEAITAADWLRQIGGEAVYRVIWEPLLKGKFGPYAERVSAVWFWNKLKLRGGSRGKGGAEELAYVRGSFARVAEAMADDIRAHGGVIRTHCRVETLNEVEAQAGTAAGGWQASGPWGQVTAARVAVCTAPPLLAEMIAGWASPAELDRLRRIPYLANLCLVLELDRPLSSTYWLNVNEPDFPFVGVIEHTNFQPASRYGGRHFVYLSRYLPHDDPLYSLGDAEVLEFALPHLKRMFPAFSTDWLLGQHVWRARWAQPVVECHYSGLIPPEAGPRAGLYLCSMAQIYPEDRGTNYALRAGRALAARLIGEGA